MGRPKGSVSKKKKIGIDLEERQPEKTSAPTPETAAEVDQPFAENPDAADKKVGGRISIKVTEDGKLDTESMQAATLAKVREFFQDPENQKLLGAHSGVKPEDVFSEKDVAMLFDLVGVCESWAFSLIGKIEPDIATKYSTWTDKEKEMIVPPAQRVIVKNAGQLQAFLRWKDEIVLGVIFLAISRAKFEGAKNEQKARNDYRRNGGTVQDVSPTDFKPFTDQPQ
jgi:hypothetical protein